MSFRTARVAFAALLVTAVANFAHAQQAAPSPLTEAPPTTLPAASASAGQGAGTSGLPTASPADGTATGLGAWLRGWADRLGASQRGFYPSAGVMTVGSGLALGGGYRDTRVAGTPLGFDLTAMASPRRYQLYRARFGLLARRNDLPSLAPADESLPWLFDEGWSRTPGTALYGEATYRKFPQLALYHGNAEAVGDDRADYGVSGTSYDVVVQRQVNAHLAVTSRVGLLQPTISAAEEDRFPGTDTAVDRARGAGLGRQPDLLTLGIGATLDTRDRADRPTAGNFIGVALWQYQPRSAGSGFTRLTVDARQYASPFGSTGVLALRALVSSDLSPGTDRVPFYLQHTLGGDALRGFGNFRLRDNSLAYLTAEYRVRVGAFLDLVPFVEAGAAGSSLGSAVSSRVYSDVGVGARFSLAGKTFLHVDWARGREGSRVSIGTGLLF